MTESPPKHDRVFLTGATGFVGSHILRALLDAGYPVRALRRQRRTQGRDEIDGIEWVHGDLGAVGGFARALRGCRFAIHCAALYSFAPRDRAQLRRINVDGTASLMAAAHVAGVERVVLTSSSATLDHAHSGYHRSKLEQERAAFAGRVPVVALLPTAPVGPGDAKPTPTGRLILDFLNGRIAARPPRAGGMNLVAVEDVARVHVAALANGRTGERYVVGGENLTMDAIWELLAESTGRRLPRWRAPYPLALAAGYADDLRCRITGGDPAIPLEGVRLSRERMYADSSAARRDLGFHPSPVRDALERAVQWYRANVSR